MERWREKELRDEYLLLLWRKQRDCNFGADTSNKELCDELGIEFNGPAVRICKSLQGKELIDWQSFDRIHLTLKGREVAEEMDNQRWEAKEKQLLKILYEGRGRPDGFYPDELAKLMKLDVTEIQDLIIEVERKEWAKGSDETTWIAPAGIKEYEKIPEPSIPHIAVYNPTNSPMNFGANSYQLVTYNNQPAQQILPDLVKLMDHIRSQDFRDRDEVLDELEKVRLLVTEKMDEGNWHKAQLRLNAAKTLMEIARYGYNSIPYWPIVWHYFFRS